MSTLAAAHIHVIGLVIGLLLAAVVYWLVAHIAPPFVAVLAAILVFLVALAGGVSL